MKFREKNECFKETDCGLVRNFDESEFKTRQIQKNMCVLKQRKPLVADSKAF